MGRNGMERNNSKNGLNRCPGVRRCMPSFQGKTAKDTGSTRDGRDGPRRLRDDAAAAAAVVSQAHGIPPARLPSNGKETPRSPPLGSPFLRSGPEVTSPNRASTVPRLVLTETSSGDHASARMQAPTDVA